MVGTYIEQTGKLLDFHLYAIARLQLLATLVFRYVAFYLLTILSQDDVESKSLGLL